jgi:hypothetical protein
VLHSGGAGVAGHPDAAAAQAGGEDGAAAAVDVAAQGVRPVVDHGDGGAFFRCGEGCLQAQDAAAQDHHALAAFHGLAQYVGVTQVPKGCDAGRQDRRRGIRVDAGQVGYHRTRSGGEYQPVVVGHGAVGQEDLLPGPVHAADADAEAHVHAVGGQGVSIGKRQGLCRGPSHAQVGDEHPVVSRFRLRTHHREVHMAVPDGRQELVNQPGGHRAESHNDNLLAHEASVV